MYLREINSVITLNILSLTLSRPVCFINEIADYTHLSLEVLMDYLRILENEGLVRFVDVDGFMAIKVLNRLMLAYNAIKSGVDVKRISKFLNWKEFEILCYNVMESFEYVCHRNVRFKFNSKRFEIDVIGYKMSYVICLDCKHWSTNRISMIKKIIKVHYDKTLIFSKVFKNIFNLNLNGKILFIPVVITLLDEIVGIYDGLPVVSIFKLNSFLNDLPIGIKYIKSAEVHY